MIQHQCIQFVDQVLTDYGHFGGLDGGHPAYSTDLALYQMYQSTQSGPVGTSVYHLRIICYIAQMCDAISRPFVS